MSNYDLLSINGVALPDPDPTKGSIAIQKNPIYTKYECEDGGSVIDLVQEHMIKGSVSYSGLFQDQAQTISAACSTVSVLEVYNPMTGSKRRCSALITPGEMVRIIHDDRANAWSFSFEYEEIGDAPEPEEET